jgi:hypothetical protein
MIEDYYKTIIVYRLVETTNAFGATVKNWVLKDEIQGLINMSGPEKQSVIADQYQVLNPYNLYCALDGGLGWTTSQLTWLEADIPWEMWNDDDKVVKQGDKVEFNGEVFRVVSNAKNTVQRNHHLKFILERLDADVQVL